MRTTNGVQSVDRALRIIEVLAEERDGLRLVELCARTELAPSTAHRLLAALQDREFVSFVQQNGTWVVGRQAFKTGAAFVRRHAVAGPAMARMRALRDLARETINIGAPDDGSIVIMGQVESREIVRAINIIGGRAPLSSSALGKAILATYSEANLTAHLERHGLPRCTAHTLTDPVSLNDDLTQTRAAGFAKDFEEHLSGLHCVAAPVFASNGDAVAAISISALAARMPIERMEQLGPMVAEAAAALTHDQGGRPPEEWSMPV